MTQFIIRQIEIADRPLIKGILAEHWGSARVVSRGNIYRADELPGFIAIEDNQIFGIITYNIKDKNCEIVTLNSFREQRGIGGELIDKVKDIALIAGCKRLWLITTNDNIKALKFYQKRGFVIAAIHVNAIEKSRLLKPEIPLTGNDGIPIRDEIELEIPL